MIHLFEHVRNYEELLRRISTWLKRVRYRLTVILATPIADTGTDLPSVPVVEMRTIPPDAST